MLKILVNLLQSSLSMFFKMVSLNKIAIALHDVIK